MKKVIFSFIVLAFSFSTLFGQKVRYIHQIFDSVNITDTYYGSNVTVLATPIFRTVPLPVRIFTPKGDTVKNRPLVIMCHTGNFLPFPTNGGVSGRNLGPTDQYAGIAALGMGFPIDSALTEISTRLTKMGYVVAAIDYRTGWNPIASTQPERVNTLINAAYRGVQDFRTAIRFFKLTAKLLGNPYRVDTAKIVGWGLGTGGYITMAAATMDAYSDIVEKSSGKFIGGTATQPIPMVIPPIHGDINGTAFGRFVRDSLNTVTQKRDTFRIDTLSLPNHLGYNSDFQLCVNMGGAIADTQWIDASDIPMIGFHEPRDLFAPYKEGVVNVPLPGGLAPLPVVTVQGSFLAVQKVDNLGLNKKMRDLKLNDVITQAANKKNEGVEGLYPINGDPSTPRDSDPWTWWDSTVMKIIAPNNHANSITGSPGMSAAKGRRYIDTIIAYYAPRAFAVLNLGTFVSTPDLLKDHQVGLKIMPNPLTTQTTIQSNPDSKIKGITVYDINGRVVRTIKNVNSNQYILQRNNMPTGIYYVQIGFDKGNITKSIVVQ